MKVEGLGLNVANLPSAFYIPQVQMAGGFFVKVNSGADGVEQEYVGELYFYQGGGIVDHFALSYFIGGLLLG